MTQLQHRQMTLLAARIRRELASNGNVLTAQVRRWMDRLAQLVKALKGRLSAGAMRGALGSLAVFFGLASASGQSFAPGVPNPFGLTVPPEEMTTSFQFVDIDADGDLDMLSRSFGYDYYSYTALPSFRFHENVGTPDAPAYLPAVDNPFGGLEGIAGWDAGYAYGGLAMDFADLDGDGDFDLVAIDRYGYFYSTSPYAYGYYLNVAMYAENIGSPAAPAFGDWQLQPFNMNLMPLMATGDESVFAFDFADIDGDGDLDMLGTVTNFGSYSPNGEVERAFFWCQNTGSATAPQFAAPEVAPMGLPDVDAGPAAEGLSFGLQMLDLDLDGDLDVVETTYLGYSGYEALTELRFHENTGSESAPAFGAHVVSPFGLEMNLANGIFMAQFADVDGDGDADALFNDFYASYYSYGEPMPLIFQENVGGVSSVSDLAADADHGLLLWPNPARPHDFLTLNGNFTSAQILDAKGAVVQSLIDTRGVQGIALEGLAPGAYLLRAEGAIGEWQSARFVVE
jgi:hypothetical protein